MEELRREFPVLSKYTYLNTPSCGLISNSLNEWREKHNRSLRDEASLFRDTHNMQLREVKNTVRNFFSATESHIALIPNFSLGINMLLDALDPKLKILLLETDYPSINWAVQHRGFEVVFAAIDGDLEQNIEQAILHHQPDVFVFSVVQYLNGIKIDFQFLDQLKAYHPKLLLIADGTQYLGTESFNFSESPFDILLASSYKWLISGYGNAFMIVKEEAKHYIAPRTIGFNSADGNFGKQNEIPLIKYFEPGHLDTLNFGSLQHSLRWMEKLGVDKITEWNANLIKKAKEAFSELGLLEEAVVQRNEHATIFNLNAGEAVFKTLTENRIICSQRANGIRVGFHFYNTEDDLLQLLDILKTRR
jgi:selenocysteine lyase/cysteine desulfurase